MAVNHILCNEEATALHRSSDHLDDIGRPRPASQPSLRRAIAQVETHPDEIRAICRDLDKIVQRLPQPAAECKRE
jgi:hypothetical protein